MKRFLLVTALLTSSPAAASVYNVDIFGSLPDGVSGGATAGIASTNACSATICAGGWNTAYAFQAQPGDVINFGTLSLYPYIFGDSRTIQPTQYIDENGQLQFGHGMPVALVTGSLGVSDHFVYSIQLDYRNSWIGSCNTGDPSCYPNLESRQASTLPHQYDLEFILTTGFIELGWTQPAIYTAPAQLGAVPEISTWIMLLIGFFGIACSIRMKANDTELDVHNGSRLSGHLPHWLLCCLGA